MGFAFIAAICAERNLYILIVAFYCKVRIFFINGYSLRLILPIIERPFDGAEFGLAVAAFRGGLCALAHQLSLLRARHAAMAHYRFFAEWEHILA